MCISSASDCPCFTFTTNAHLYPVRTDTHVLRKFTLVSTSPSHPYQPQPLTRINLSLSPVSTSVSHSLYSLK